VIKELHGVSYKYVAYIGNQVVRGENHYIFEGKPSIACIIPIGTTTDTPTLFGYAFNW